MNLPLQPLRIEPDALALSPREPFLGAAASDRSVERENDAALRIEPVATRATPARVEGGSDWSDDVAAGSRHGETATHGEAASDRPRRLRLLLACIVASAAGYAAYAYVEIAHPDVWRRVRGPSPATAPAASTPPPASGRQEAAEIRAGLAAALVAPPPPEKQSPAAAHADGAQASPGLTAGAQELPAAAQRGARALPAHPPGMAGGAAPAPARTPSTPNPAATPAPESAPSLEPTEAAVTRSATTEHEALVHEAWEALDAGRSEAALALYRRALAARPGLTAALLGEAAALTRLGQLAEAQQRYLAVLQSDPGNSIARGNLLRLRLDTDQPPGEDVIRELIAQRPSAFLYALLGHVSARSGRWDAARDAFQTAHHLQPAQAEHAFNLAVSLEHLGETRLALQHYRHALVSGEGRAPAPFDLAHAARRIAILGDERGD